LTLITAVMKVLEAAGVEFLNHGQPGVRSKKQAVARKPLNPDGTLKGWTKDPDEVGRIPD
jgi:hypothetical protein